MTKKSNNKPKISIIILRTIISIFLILATIGTLDIILVNNYNVGPYFAIKTKKNKDNIYYGFGYKIIQYKEINGRYDTKIGTLAMKYNNKPIKVELIDLAIDYVNHVKKTYQTYYGKYIEMTETIDYIDNTNKIIRLKYTDPDGKYSLAMDYYLYDSKTDLSKYNQGDKITIVGTIDGYRNKADDSKYYTLTVKNAFIINKSN